MPKFNAYVSVYKDPAEHVEFAPGDEVPDWALDKVGDHVLEGNGVEEDDVRLRDPHYEEDSPEVQFSTPTVLPPARPKVADDVEEEESDGYGSLSKAELQEEAESRGLAKSGTKDELIARLEEDDEAEDEE